MLGNSKVHGEAGVQQSKHCPHRRGKYYSTPKAAALIDPHPSSHRSDGHDALNAEVEHACPLANQFAECAKYQGARNSDRGGPETGCEQYLENVAHQRNLIRYCDSNTLQSTASTDAPTRTSAM